jgi:hypothetical protein
MGGDPENMNDEEWRRYVNDRLRQGNERFDALELQGAEMRSALAANTSLTAGVKQDVADLKVRVQPVLDTIKTMEVGIRTIGRIGDLGSNLLRAGLYAVAVWIMLKLLLLGSSWTDALQAFRDTLGK